MVPRRRASLDACPRRHLLSTTASFNIRPYGALGSVPKIPPYSTLVFLVNLVDTLKTVTRPADAVLENTDC